MEKYKEVNINKNRGNVGEASTSRGADPLEDDVPIPFILHLDPIANGGHDTQTVGHALRQWLRYFTTRTLRAHSCLQSYRSRHPA